MTPSIRLLFALLCCTAVACGEVSTTPTDAAIDSQAIDAPIDAPIDATPTATLTVALAGNGAGSVASSPAGITCGTDCTEDYPEGVAVTLTATATSGSTFVGWSGGGCTGAGTCTVVLNTATTVTATFALNNALVVTLTGTGGGTVTSTPAGIDCGADCTEAFAPGTLVTLTAVPDATSTFAGWSGAGCSGTGACTVTTDSALGVVATFTRLIYSLNVVRAGTGTCTVTSSPAGINCGADCSEDFVAGTAVTLIASPSSGSVFVGWSGGGCSGSGPCSVPMTGSVTVTATCALTQHTLVVTRAGTGTGTVTSSPAGINCGADCAEVYNFGTMVTLTAAAAAGSTFAGWSGGGCTGTGTCTTTIAAATTVTATFNLQSFTLTVNRAGTGTGTVTSSPAGINCGATCAASFNAGTVVTLTAAAGTGSAFAGWSGGGCTGTGTCTVTMNAATTVSATFNATTVTLTVTRAGAGTGTVTSSPGGINCGATCAANFAVGAVVTLTAAPATGSRFTGWSGGGCTGTGTCAVTMSAATAVTATFAIGGCDAFSYADGTTVPNWTENAGDWFIESGRLRNAIANGVYNHNITMNGSTQLDGCGRLTAIHNGAAGVQVVGVVLRFTPPASFIIALVQDNNGTGNFNSAWIYQNPGTMSIGGVLTNQAFGLTPNIEACVTGTAVTLRVDAAQDGIYETTLTGTTTLTGAGLTGVMAASQSTSTTNMPRIDNFCWGP